MRTNFFVVSFGLMLAVVWPGGSRGATSSVVESYRPRVEKAVDRAIDYLVKTQKKDGTFDRDHWGDNTAIVGLAGMAFLAAGHTPSHPVYGTNLNRCVDYIMSRKREDGFLFFTSAGVLGHGGMYAHGIATLFLSEVSGMLDPERQRRLDPVLAKAVKLILDAQNVPKPPHMQGGWRYQPTSKDSDLSVTGWNLMALRSARLNGARVPDESIEKAVAYVKRLYNKTKGGFGYNMANPSATMSGVGLLSLEVTGHHGDPMTKRAGKLINEATNEKGHIAWGGANVPGRYAYQLYYCTNAMYQLGGPMWDEYMPKIFEGILKSQGKEGNWGGAYDTSMRVLCLAVTYRQLPIYQR